MFFVRGRRTPGLLILRVIAAACLAVDAWVHADLAAEHDPVGTDISQGTLFRIQAALAALAAVLILVHGRRLAATFGLLVALSAFGAVVVYRYVDVGTVGPIPNMYEPFWYTEKTVSAVAEGVAAAASAALLVLQVPRRTLRVARWAAASDGAG
jgi:hypothetical protein